MQEVLQNYKAIIDTANPIKEVGIVTSVLGNLIESNGPRMAVGNQCKIVTGSKSIDAEVMGIREEKLLLMAYEDVHGIDLESRVICTHSHLSISGGDRLLGRVIDARGVPMDNQGEIYSSESISVTNNVPDLRYRDKVNTQLLTGIKVIDAFMPLAEGQKVGIFSGSGVGKTMLLEMIARNINADVTVLALIGERNREVYDFMHHVFDAHRMANCVVVISTSDTAPLARVKGAFTALSIADYFCHQGKRVALLFDSISRFARAQREIGLAIGEPPTTRGYPPSVYTRLPQLIERCGLYTYGSLTGIFSVLVDGDDIDEPISDAMRGLLDGHIVLSRSKAQRNHYPAIDIRHSLSRLAKTLVNGELHKSVTKIRNGLALYEESEELIQIGAYQHGTNKELDMIIKYLPQINDALQQTMHENTTFAETKNAMQDIAYKLSGGA